MNRALLPALFVGCCLITFSCVHYSPKPRGYFRIEPSAAVYHSFSPGSVPCRFDLSRQVRILYSSPDSAVSLELHYDSLNAVIYCSYLHFDPKAFETTDRQLRDRVARDARSMDDISEQEFDHPESDVYGSLFYIAGDVPSPIQFHLTDSASRYFTGALLFNSRPNADSLAPAMEYIRKDIRELMQSFSWK